MWKASRCAVRVPTPGSFESSVTSRWTGGAKVLTRAAAGSGSGRGLSGPLAAWRAAVGRERSHALQPRQAEAAERAQVEAPGRPAHPLAPPAPGRRAAPR